MKSTAQLRTPSPMKTSLPQSRAHRLPSFPLLVLLLLSIADRAPAATEIWSAGGTDGKWGTPANWQSGSPPAPNDSLVFTNTIRLSNTNNLLGATVSGITFATPSGGFNLFGNALTLSGGLTNK